MTVIMMIITLITTDRLYTFYDNDYDDDDDDVDDSCVIN